MENKTPNTSPETSNAEGLDNLAPDFFDNFALAVSLRNELSYDLKEETAEKAEKFESITISLGEEVRKNIKTNQEISDFIDKILETFYPDNLVKKDGKIVGFTDESRLGHAKGLSVVWDRIYDLAFKDGDFEQITLIDKKFFYVWTSVLNEVENKLLGPILSEDRTWQILKSRLLDGRNTLQQFFNICYMRKYEGGIIFITRDVYKKYLRIIMEAINEKPENERNILKSIYIPNEIRADLMNDEEGVGLINFFDIKKKMLSEKK